MGRGEILSLEPALTSLLLAENEARCHQWGTASDLHSCVQSVAHQVLVSRGISTCNNKGRENGFFQAVG